MQNLDHTTQLNNNTSSSLNPKPPLVEKNKSVEDKVEELSRKLFNANLDYQSLAIDAALLKKEHSAMEIYVKKVTSAYEQVSSEKMLLIEEREVLLKHYHALKKGYFSASEVFLNLQAALAMSSKETHLLKKEILELKELLEVLATEEGKKMLLEMMEKEKNERTIRELKLKTQRAKIAQLSKEVEKPKTRTERAQSL